VRRNAAYYRCRYRQPGLTTDLPDAQELAALLGRNFRGTDKDFGEKIAVFHELCPRGRVLDFGCSWGYGVVQLNARGYETIGFDVSAPRAAYGRARLGVEILDSYEALDRIPAGSFDGIFSNHVLEHLPTPRIAFDRFARLLRPQGILVAFVPNAGGTAARHLRSAWGPLLCQRHTVALDRRFVEASLPRHGFEVHVSSDPYRPREILRSLDGGLRAKQVDGDELLIVARRRGCELLSRDAFRSGCPLGPSTDAHWRVMRHVAVERG
jgi:SAM-dependent methyltransferase